MIEPLLIFVALLAVANLILLLLGGRKESSARLEARLEELGRSNERLEREIREEHGRGRSEAAQSARESREEMASNFETFSRRLGDVSKNLDERLETIRVTVEQRLERLQIDNGEKLEQMRATVDEKLQSTLEKRLADSFTLVSDRLEQVHKGLGEMQSLASGVGDLKRVLSNVKQRGTWGEYQLGNLLEQFLSPGQYVKNVVTRPGSSERVEFAVKLPGRDGGSEVLLPIDSKFPLEDYQRLVEAQDRGDIPALEEAGKALEVRIVAQAKDIRDKYLSPPETTDFAILFLPLESLYAEVLRRPGLFEKFHREFRVTVTGPTTLTAFLNSLQMGFHTLTIERRSSEIRETLGAVKAEFGKFGDQLAKVKKKLEDAANQVDVLGTRSRAVQKKLKGIDELPEGDAARVLALGSAADEDEGEEESLEP